MKSLIKGLLTFVLIIVILVGGSIGIISYMVIDNSNYVNEKYEAKN